MASMIIFIYACLLICYTIKNTVDCTISPKAIDIWKKKCYLSDKLIEWQRHDEDLYNFLKSSIPEALAHTGSSDFDLHLKGVQTILRSWNSPNYLTDAGLFHSIYGTEGYQGYKCPILRRQEIRNLIGTEAERMVWMFCVVDRKSFDIALDSDEHCDINSIIKLTSRVELGRFDININNHNEWLDFIELTLADWLEQVEGASERVNPLLEWNIGEAWSYRRIAYKKMLDILLKYRYSRLKIAEEMFDDIYSRESSRTKHLIQEITPPISQAAKDAREAMLSIHL